MIIQPILSETSMVSSVIAERARHAAAARIERFDGKLGNEPECSFDRPHRVECLLMAVAVQKDFLRQRPQRQVLDLPARCSRGEKFLEKKCIRSQRTRRLHL